MKRYLMLVLFPLLLLLAALPFAVSQGEVEGFNPVTAEMLLAPSDGDWLHWRRTYDAWGYSPLDQINTENVGELELAWAWTMLDGRQETTPLIYDGVMYLHNFGDTVQALDAATGDLIWEYVREIPEDLIGSSHGTSRGMAIYGDNIYFLSADTKVVALDAATGQVAWETAVGNWEFGYRYTNAPLIADGKVISGMTGCGGAQPGGCYIVAHDAMTGEEVWRVHTIARPGTPEGDTWNGLPLEARYGSSAWNTGSYDPEQNLIFWGTGQPYPWAAEMNGLLPLQAGNNNDALFTDTTLVINASTGELVWYHQWLPNDTWDNDYAYEQMLIDAEVDGEMRKLLVVVGKLGIVEAIDRVTGEWLWAHETVFQNVVESIDPDTGVKTINEETIPRIGQTTVNCPGDPGSRSWAATSYSPRTNHLYLPMQEFCIDATPRPLDPGEIYQGGGLITFDRRLVPGSDNAGRVEAVSLDTQDTTWTHFMRPANGGSAALATGGGLVFTGNLNREFMAFDDTTGELLWQTRLSNVPNGYPVSYEAGGDQYIAVPVGFGSGPSRAFSVLTPEIRNVPGGSALFVFRLPKSN